MGISKIITKMKGKEPVREYVPPAPSPKDLPSAIIKALVNHPGKERLPDYGGAILAICQRAADENKHPATDPSVQKQVIELLGNDLGW